MSPVNGNAMNARQHRMVVPFYVKPRMINCRICTHLCQIYIIIPFDQNAARFIRLADEINVTKLKIYTRMVIPAQSCSDESERASRTSNNTYVL